MGDEIEMFAADDGYDVYDDGYVIIDPFTFPFYWFGVNYGIPEDNSKTIYFTTNSILSFGPIDFTLYGDFVSSISFNGIYIGTKDRSYNKGYQYNPIFYNGYHIKKIKVNLSHYRIQRLDDFEIEIRFICNPDLKTQYIEIKILKLNDDANSASNVWGLKYSNENDLYFFENFKEKSNWTSPAVNTIYVLESNENGDNWTLLSSTTDIDTIINQNQYISNIQPTNIAGPVNLVRPIYTAKSIKTTYP